MILKNIKIKKRSPWQPYPWANCSSSTHSRGPKSLRPWQFLSCRRLQILRSNFGISNFVYTVFAAVAAALPFRPFSAATFEFFLNGHGGRRAFHLNCIQKCGRPKIEGLIFEENEKILQRSVNFEKSG